MRDILAAHGVKHLYLENKATLAYADRVRAALPGVEVDTGAVLSDAIDAIRAVKSEEEFDAIRRAQVITDACFEHMLGYIKPGVREIDAALEMEVFMKSHGAGKLEFEKIAVSPARSWSRGQKRACRTACPATNASRRGTSSPWTSARTWTDTAPI